MTGHAAKGFPWLSHRSLAAVARTEALLEQRASRKLVALEVQELDLLLTKKLRHNPPPPPDQPA